MSVSPAASKSLLLSNFAPASRLAPGQANAFAGNNWDKINRRAADFIKSHAQQSTELQKAGVDGGWTDSVKKLAEEFGIALGDAESHIVTAGMRAAGMLKGMFGGGGGTPVGPIATAPKVQNFSTMNEAKAFAQEAIKLLKVGIERFNASVRDWTPQKAQEAREKTWQGLFDGFRRSNPDATEEEAIAFADKGLKGYLATEGHMDESVLRDAIGRLQSGFVMSGPLYTENADGTLSLNRTELRTREGKLVFEIGADLGQNIDRAA